MRRHARTLELAYFRKHRKRMRYMELQSKGLMIGSGVVEAACKTLVTQRLKQSGMRWSVSGAQAILPPRGWDQSDRFDEAWALIAEVPRGAVARDEDAVRARADLQDGGLSPTADISTRFTSRAQRMVRGKPAKLL